MHIEEIEPIEDILEKYKDNYFLFFNKIKDISSYKNIDFGKGDNLEKFKNEYLKEYSELDDIDILVNTYVIIDLLKKRKVYKANLNEKIKFKKIKNSLYKMTMFLFENLSIYFNYIEERSEYFSKNFNTNELVNLLVEYLLGISLRGYVGFFKKIFEAYNYIDSSNEILKNSIIEIYNILKSRDYTTKNKDIKIINKLKINEKEYNKYFFKYFSLGDNILKEYLFSYLDKLKKRNYRFKEEIENQTEEEVKSEEIENKAEEEVKTEEIENQIKTEKGNKKMEEIIIKKRIKFCKEKKGSPEKIIELDEKNNIINIFESDGTTNPPKVIETSYNEKMNYIIKGDLISLPDLATLKKIKFSINNKTDFIPGLICIKDIDNNGERSIYRGSEIGFEFNKQTSVEITKTIINNCLFNFLYIDHNRIGYTYYELKQLFLNSIINYVSNMEFEQERTKEGLLIKSCAYNDGSLIQKIICEYDTIQNLKKYSIYENKYYCETNILVENEYNEKNEIIKENVSIIELKENKTNNKKNIQIEYEYDEKRNIKRIYKKVDILIEENTEVEKIILFEQRFKNEYNEKDDLIKTTIIEDCIEKRIEEYIYDENKNLIKKYVFDDLIIDELNNKKGKYNYKHIYKYDIENNLINEEIIKSRKGELLDKDKGYWDLYNKGAIKPLIETYKIFGYDYDYDDEFNIIEKHFSIDDISFRPSYTYNFLGIFKIEIL